MGYVGCRAATCVCKFGEISVEAASRGNFFLRQGVLKVHGRIDNQGAWWVNLLTAEAVYLR